MKQKRYWLRVGITLAIINIILCVIAFNLPEVKNPHNNSDLIALLFPNILISSFALSWMGWSEGMPTILVYLIPGSIFWFIVGAILGWIYGKIKNRNKVNL